MAVLSPIEGTVHIWRLHNLFLLEQSEHLAHVLLLYCLILSTTTLLRGAPSLDLEILSIFAIESNQMIVEQVFCLLHHLLEEVTRWHWKVSLHLVDFNRWKGQNFSLLDTLHTEIPSIAYTETVLFEAKVFLTSRIVMTNGSCIDDEVFSTKVLMHIKLLANFLTPFAS